MFNNRFLTGFDGMSRFEIKLNTVTIVTIGGYVASDFISNCNYAATESSLNFLDQDNDAVNDKESRNFRGIYCSKAQFNLCLPSWTP